MEAEKRDPGNEVGCVLCLHAIISFAKMFLINLKIIWLVHNNHLVVVFEFFVPWPIIL